MAPEEKLIEELRQLWEQLFDLYYTGKEKEGAALIEDAIVRSKDVEAYRLFFEGQRARYNTDYKLQEELIRKAIEIRPEDYFLIRGLGVALSFLGKYDESIECYDKAIAIKPDYYTAYNNKGASLSKLGKDDEAIVCFDEAIAIKPDYYMAYNNKGTSLSKLGKYDEAIVCYDKAIAIKPDYYAALGNKGISLSNMGKYKEALETIKKAYSIAPDNRFITQVLKNICTVLKLNFDDVVKDIQQSKTDTGAADEHKPTGGRVAEDNLKDVNASVSLTVDAAISVFERDIDVFHKQMAKVEEKKDEYFAPVSGFNPDFPLLLTLRKWNSYTPIIPSDGDERSIGGGYFIYYNNKGTVIDPGYNFIENLYKAGGRVFDIDNIIITHAHNDHTIDFESILTLLFKYNGKHNFKEGQAGHKAITLYMNLGSFIKFSGLINLREFDYIKDMISISAGKTYDIDDGFTMTALPTYHDEVITKKYGVGLHLSFDFGKDATGNEIKRNILLTSDTSLFPKDNKEIDISKPAIHALYGNSIKQNVNLLVAHIGTIKKEEVIQETTYKERFNKNHLGLLGTSSMITTIRPNLALISEFGEELREFRDDLIKMLNTVVERHPTNDGKKPQVLPADLPFIYNIKDETIYCIVNREMVDYKEIISELFDNVFYYRSKDEMGCNKVKKAIDDYNNDLQKHDIPYFKTYKER
ncbi:MAG: tetratricopeptide repeat protein [Candidatus Magnetominusculus sp. LBB02]|nr:tetratricopeptide repeat protein [Candidatus Magnetominusculus sp. LBB02]